MSEHTSFFLLFLHCIYPKVMNTYLSVIKQTRARTSLIKIMTSLFSTFLLKSDWTHIWAERNQMNEVIHHMNLVPQSSSKHTVHDPVYITAMDNRKISELSVTLSAGRNLPAMDITGNSDCYAIITLGNVSFRSRVVTSLNPQWNETFAFRMDGRMHCNYIIFDVFDRDTLTQDDHIGIATIHLSNYAKYRNNYQWVPLQRVSNHSKPKKSYGEIKVKLQANNLILNHNKLYQKIYNENVLPLTRSLSLNALLVKSTTIRSASAPSLKQNTNPRTNLKRYITFNVLPLAQDDTKSPSTPTNDEEDMKTSLDEVPHFIDEHSSAMYHQTDQEQKYDAFIEYPAICESIEIFIPNVIFLFNKFEKSLIYGDLYLTNFRIVLKIYHKNRGMHHDLSQQVHFGAILDVKCAKCMIPVLQNKEYYVLTLKVNDGRIIQMHTDLNSNPRHNLLLHELHIRLNITTHNITTHRVLKQNADVTKQLDDKWNVLNINNEFKRQKLNQNIWKPFDNTDFGLCNTYPSVLYIPYQMNNPKEIQHAASCRSKSRLPVLVWYNHTKNNSLLRCSQPSGNDSFYIDKIRLSVANARDNLCFINDVFVIIFDCRSHLAAEANRLKGKGTENVNNYTGNSSIEFLEIGNIHCMRRSYDALINIINDRHLYDEYTENEWLQHVKDTQWNSYITLLIKSSVAIAARLFKHKDTVCIVHCSDGWDRTSQVAALSQLLIDPHFRTIHGLIALIEKEWLLFGHKFNDRNGLSHKHDQRSPIFFQFLECVWQVMQIYPAEFEFTSGFILRLCHHHKSHWFGNFMCNSRKERIQHRVADTTVSLWSWPVIKNRKYNPTLEFLEINVENTPLQPIFYDYFLRFDHVFSALSNVDMSKIEMDGSEYVTVKPKWVHDSGCTVCSQCKAEFNFFYRRKHHCRSCGQIFCDLCSRMRIELKQFDYNEPVRVCIECYELNKL
eukprot:40591_1